MQKLAWLFEFGAKFDSLNKATKVLRQADEKIKSITQKAGAKMAPAVGKADSAFKKMVPGLKSAAMGLAKFGAAAAGAAVVGVAVLGAFGAKFALDAAIFKESTLTAFKTFTGSTEAASALYAKVLKASDTFAVAPKDAMDSVKQLLGAGFEAEKAMELFAAATDLSKLTGGDTKGLTTVLGQIKAKGKLQTEELLQLAESGGLGMDKVITEIGKLKGIDTSTVDGIAKVQKLLEGGKIDSATGITAALNAIKGMTGKDIGKFAEEAGKSVGGLIERLKNMPQQWLLAFDASGAMGPLKNLLAKVVELVGPESAFAQKVIGTLGRLSNLFGKIFDSAAGGGGIEAVLGGLADAFDIVASALEKAWPYLEALGSGLFAGLASTLGPLLKKLQNMGGSVDETTLKRWASFGESVGKLIGGLVWLASVLGGPVLSAFMSTVSWLGTWWGILEAVATAVYDFIKPLIDLGAQIWQVGSDLMSGLWEGIKSGFTWLLKQFEGLIALLPDKVKQILGIASPSKVFADLGKFTMQGYQLGIEGQAANTNGAIQSAVAAPSPAQVAGAASGGGGGGNVFHITVQVAAQPGMSQAEAQAQGDAAGQGIVEQLAAYFGKTA